MSDQSYYITIPTTNERWDMPENLASAYWVYLKGLDAATRTAKYGHVHEEWFHSLSKEDQDKIKKSKAY